ncbi:hypothetical protein [Psittacicella hinzii]|uniref:Uncharacterized protein n=1 Tax=Psittacicella hinzii TaxID=2028575 RepID=A0A3A1YUE8_9GAMM|nr:hypothetical protein [Psittacicella hinzii]RIY39697.1 hypothetical protein CKF58_01750 [Psittacicella hinzii]
MTNAKRITKLYGKHTQNFSPLREIKLSKGLLPLTRKEDQKTGRKSHVANFCCDKTMAYATFKMSKICERIF